jgi:hypothetical protein
VRRIECKCVTLRFGRIRVRRIGVGLRNVAIGYFEQFTRVVAVELLQE